MTNKVRKISWNIFAVRESIKVSYSRVFSFGFIFSRRSWGTNNPRPWWGHRLIAWNARESDRNRGREEKGRKRRWTKAVSRKIEDFSMNFTHHEATARRRRRRRWRQRWRWLATWFAMNKRYEYYWSSRVVCTSTYPPFVAILLLRLLAVNPSSSSCNLYPKDMGIHVYNVITYYTRFHFFFFKKDIIAPLYTLPRKIVSSHYIHKYLQLR